MAAALRALRQVGTVRVTLLVVSIAGILILFAAFIVTWACVIAISEARRRRRADW